MSIFNKVKSIYNEVNYQGSLLTELVYPRRCAVCKNEIDTGYFCPSCRKNFVLNKTVEGFENLDKVLMLYKYHQNLQEAIHNVKFVGVKTLLPLLKEEAQLAIASDLENFNANFDIVTCVPTSLERRYERGFDAPAEIFNFFDYRKWQPHLLRRVRNTLPLFELEPSLRKQEVAGCFAVEHSISGKSVLICDDIFTTGSTLSEAAEALRKAGAVSVTALAFTASKDNW